MIERAELEDYFRTAISGCDPARFVRYATRKTPITATVGIAIGKAALGMARGAGPIARGVAVTTADDGRGVPDGWAIVVGDGAEAILDMIASTRATEPVLALISGGAEELYASRRTAIADGGLARLCEATITTLAISNVAGGDLRAIGGGPTIADRPRDRAEVVAEIEAFAWAIDSAMEAYDIGGPHQPTVLVEPMRGDLAEIATALAASRSWLRGVAWGRVPDGRVLPLALEVARRLRGDPGRILVASSDGAAGAVVDDTTWDAIVAAGIDPEHCDARAALEAVGATFATGPTGIDHGDIAIIA